jgi:pyrroline-5-carboxylate reductase
MKIVFVGAGNMASALIGGLISRGVVPSDIVIIDTSPTQREQVASRFGVREAAEPGLAGLTGDEMIVLAVKPQQMRNAATALAPFLNGQLVVSVAAGIRIPDLSRWLGGHTRMVRAMPNTPALIGLGVTGLAAHPGVPKADRDVAEQALSAVGATVWVEDDTLIDAVTAVSGSGPAYVFLFIEALESAAIQLGLSPEQARTLVLGTVAGAAQLAQRSPETPAVLRERVTSKGGTTAAALSCLEAADFRALMARAVAAARQRGAELGDEFGSD